jgi:hypothetical protein
MSQSSLLAIDVGLLASNTVLSCRQWRPEQSVKSMLSSLTMRTTVRGITGIK